MTSIMIVKTDEFFYVDLRIFVCLRIAHLSDLTMIKDNIEYGRFTCK